MKALLNKDSKAYGFFDMYHLWRISSTFFYYPQTPLVEIYRILNNDTIS